MSALEEELALQIVVAGLPEPVREYRFAAAYVGRGPGLRRRLAAAQLRDWRFDFAWPDRLVAAEVEGGQWARGRHVRGGGFEGDAEKYNGAALLGWTLFRVTRRMIEQGSALRYLELALGKNEKGENHV